MHTSTHRHGVIDRQRRRYYMYMHWYMYIFVTECYRFMHIAKKALRASSRTSGVSSKVQIVSGVVFTKSCVMWCQSQSYLRAHTQNILSQHTHIAGPLEHFAQNCWVTLTLEKVKKRNHLMERVNSPEQRCMATERDVDETWIRRTYMFFNYH